MKHVIWKYPLHLIPTQGLRLPVGAVIRAFAYQHDRPTIWIQADPRAPETERRVHIVGTGHQEIDPAWQYGGTVQRDGYVWHLLIEPEEGTR